MKTDSKQTSLIRDDAGDYDLYEGGDRLMPIVYVSERGMNLLKSIAAGHRDSSVDLRKGPEGHLHRLNRQRRIPRVEQQD